jgi:hypothetical protein
VKPLRIFYKLQLNTSWQLQYELTVKMLEKTKVNIEELFRQQRKGKKFLNVVARERLNFAKCGNHMLTKTFVPFQLWLDIHDLSSGHSLVNTELICASPL